MTVLLVLAAALCAGVCSANPALPEGNSAEISWAPWSAQIVSRDGPATCVGSILNKDTVLTAASCFPEGEDATKAKYVTVGATSWNLGGQVYVIKSVAKYRGPADLAVVKLDSEVEYNANVQKIAIAGKRVKPNNQVLSAGWCANKGEPSLKKIVMSTTPDNFCGGLPGNQICNKLEKGQTCEGDVGSGVWTPRIVGNYGHVNMGRIIEARDAELLGVLVRGSAENNTPAFVDLTDKDIREFLIGEKALKKSWFG